MNSTTAVVLASLAFATAAVAGPLNPPAGPVTSTMKTMVEVEPRIAINATNTPGDADSLFKITQPGSYYLTGNVAGVSFKHGIEIAVSGVTIDLNGFELAGTNLSRDGIASTFAGIGNIDIRNGTIRSWGEEGIDLGTTPTTSSRISGVLCRLNGGLGILAGANTIISECAVNQNGGGGISTNSACIVERCTAVGNFSYGITVLAGSTVRECTVRSSQLSGISVGGAGCFVLGNTCSDNGANGDGAGIQVGINRCRIEGNNCTGADTGIKVDFNGNIIIKNTCAGNTVNWSIVAGNAYGPIIDTPQGAAVNGNSAASALGTTDPNANFTFTF